MSHASPLAVWLKCKPTRLFCKMNMSKSHQVQQQSGCCRLRLVSLINCILIKREVFIIEILRDHDDGILMFMFIAPVVHHRTAITWKYLSYLHLCCASTWDASWLAWESAVDGRWWEADRFAACIWNLLQSRRAEKSHGLNMWRKRPGPCCCPAQLWLQGVAEIHKPCPLALSSTLSASHHPPGSSHGPEILALPLQHK